MLVRRLAHAAAALVGASSLACAINHPKGGSHLAPANAPAGVLAAGVWSAEMIGSPPARLRGPSSPHRAMAFEVEVSPVRDSVLLTFIYTYSNARVGSPGTANPSLSVTGRGSASRIRVRPYEVVIDDDEMTFGLANAMGWTNVRCRLKLSPRAGTWDGPCLGDDGLKAVTLTLGVPRAQAASIDR